MAIDKPPHRTRIDGHNLARKVEKLMDNLHHLENWTSDVSITVVMDHLIQIFEEEVWQVVDQVYETRWDCSTVRVAPASCPTI